MSPRAVGVRAPYAAVPARVRAWVEETLGSPVVGTEEQTGGMSPGCATRLRCADGSRAFVKAVGPELNPVTPSLFRREVVALRLIGADPLWADLLSAYDDEEGWVGLLLEDVEGVQPELDDDETMALLLSGTDRLSAALAERVPDPPPRGAATGLADLSTGFRTWASAFDHLEEIPPALLPAWVRAEAAALQETVRSLAGFSDRRLVHNDIRTDNVLQRPSGELVFLDWGAAGVGPPWTDALLARLERVDDPWFDASLASSPALVEAGEDAVTAWLVGFGTWLAHRAHTAVDVNLPTLNAFRARESHRALLAAARRLGVGERA